MADKINKQTFEEKYGLQGKGKKVIISKETRVIIESLTNESKRIIKAGEDFAKTCKHTFGQQDC